MNISDAGIAFTKSFEGCSLTAYQDEGGVWTCGWGHVGPDVFQGSVWTQEAADAQFLADYAPVEAMLNECVTAALTQPQFDACGDLAFNIGVEAFVDSTLLKLLNAGDYAGAAEQILRWDHVDGQVSKGLLRRRVAENALFTNGDYGVPT
jgi:lysozyme